jgi:hypothetical protein
MSDRLVTLLGALVALGIFYALFLRQSGEPPITKPLSIEAGRNGYLALWTWLERANVRVVSLRERYGRLLEDGSLAETGNVLIVTMPFRTPLRISEAFPLRQWIQNGNTLLVLAALDDSPEWLPYTDRSGFVTNLAALTNFGFTTPRAQGAAGDDAESADAAADDAPAGGPVRGSQPDPGTDDDAADGSGRGRAPSAFAPPPIPARTAIELEPVVAHPLLDGVESLHGYSDDASEVWLLRNANPYRLVLRLARERSTGLDALWQVPDGRGQIIVAASGSLLANRNIGTGDARELVRNIVRYHVATGGAVIFDDMHHGLSSLYDAAALFRDARLTHTIWFVLAGWLVYILGSSNRLAPPRAARTAPRQADFVAAAGGFMARRLDKCAAGLLLVDEWLADVRRARGLPRDAPLWSEIEQTPALSTSVYEELRGYHRKLVAGRAVDLVRLHNVLRTAREAIG